MQAYLNKVKDMVKSFQNFRIAHIGRGQNTHADAVATLALAVEKIEARTIVVEFLPQSSILSEAEQDIQLILCTSYGPSWMDPIIKYIREEVLLEDRKEANKVKEERPDFGSQKKESCRPVLILRPPSRC